MSTVPEVFQLNLTCNHQQLVTSKLYVVGDKYPCWSACDETRPIVSTVASIETYVPDPNVSLLVMSNASNEDMVKAARVADEVNTKL